MTLVLLILLPLLGGVAAWFVGRRNADVCRWFSLAVVLAEFGLVLRLWASHFGDASLGSSGPWLEVFERAWIPEFAPEADRWGTFWVGGTLGLFAGLTFGASLCFPKVLPEK